MLHMANATFSDGFITGFIDKHTSKEERQWEKVISGAKGARSTAGPTAKPGRERKSRSLHKPAARGGCPGRCQQPTPDGVLYLPVPGLRKQLPGAGHLSIDLPKRRHQPPKRNGMTIAQPPLPRICGPLENRSVQVKAENLQFCYVFRQK